MKLNRQCAIILALLFGTGNLLPAAAQSVITPSTNGATNVIRRSIKPGIQDPDVSAIWRLILRFEDAAVSRPQLLGETEAFLTQFPDSKYADRAHQTADLLKKMVAEDEAHAKAPPPVLDDLPLSNRVAELIFRLRDQNGHQEVQPGTCDFFADVRRSTNTPAHLLAAVGYPAVPQLIAALDDQSFTRSVSYWRDFPFSHHVMTVGDCAFAIIERISGMRFYEHHTARTLAEEKDLPAIRKDIEAWYADAQKLGEKGVLIRQVELGNNDSYTPAKLLLERYPDAAADAIMKGVKAVKTLSLAEAEASLKSRWPNQTMPESVARAEVRGSEAPRSQLLGLLADSDIKDPTVTEFFSRELKEAPDLSSRIATASGLSRRGDLTGVAAMIREWPNVVKAHTDHPAEFEAGFDLFALENFLGAADSPDAIRTLAGSLPQLSAAERHGILSSIAPNHGNSPSETRVNRSPATLAAIEEVLVSALNNTESAQGTLAYLGSHNYPDIRICDEAGYYLAQGGPDRYQFDITASRKIRERQRIECQNVWRLAHHQSPLPLPAEPASHVPEAEAVKVTHIEWATNGAQPSAAFIARMESLRNQLLTVDAFKGAVLDYQANPEPGSSGLDLQALKDEDLAGVTIVVRLLPGTTPTPCSWSYHKHVTLGNENLLSNGSAGPAGMLDDLGWNAKRALAAPPATPFLIQATVTSYAYKQR